MAIGKKKQPSGYSTALVVADKARQERWRVHNQRMVMAVTAVLEGVNSLQLQQEMQAHARRTGDTHPGWFVSITTVRILLEKARGELSKDISKSRASEYAKHQARLEHLYNKSMELRDRQTALAVLKEQIALSERLYGVINGGKKEGTLSTPSRRVGHAIRKLTQALAGGRSKVRRGAKKRPSSDATDAGVSGVSQDAPGNDDLEVQVAEASTDGHQQPTDQLDTAT